MNRRFPAPKAGGLAKLSYTPYKYRHDLIEGLAPQRSGLRVFLHQAISPFVDLTKFFSRERGFHHNHNRCAISCGFNSVPLAGGYRPLRNVYLFLNASNETRTRDLFRDRETGTPTPLWRQKYRFNDPNESRTRANSVTSCRATVTL